MQNWIILGISKVQKLAIPVGHMGRVAEYIANKAILSLAGAGAWQSLAKLGKAWQKQRPKGQV